jgi:dTDP-4-dehydrorhamnose reductase
MEIFNIDNEFKIFIFGSNGMLGNYIKSYLSKTYNVIPITRKDYDLSQLSIDKLTALMQLKNLQSNDVVINCAGVIPQASKQRGIDTRLYFTINSLFPTILSQICDKMGAKMIHITTDCVFNGKDGNYDENSIHDEINDYGMSKSLGELCKATIIRTSIIGDEINNKRSLLEWVISNKGNTINGYTNHMWNGVTCLQLSKIINEIVNNNLFWTGVRHIFSPHSVSKYELVSMINDIYNLDITIQEFSTDEKVDKTISSIHDNLFKIPGLSEQIVEMREYEINK